MDLILYGEICYFSGINYTHGGLESRLLYEQTLNYRWINSIASFNMPVDLILGEKKTRVKPTTKWAKLEVTGKSDVKIDED